MPIIKLEADNSTIVDTTVSGTVTFVGHFTASVADTTAGQTFDGVFALDQLIDGDWIETEEFTASGVFPGFNGITGQYRLRVKTKPTAGVTGKAIVNGNDKKTGVYI